MLTPDDLGRLRALAIQMMKTGRLIQVDPAAVLELVTAEERARTLTDRLSKAAGMICSEYCSVNHAYCSEFRPAGWVDTTGKDRATVEYRDGTREDVCPE